MSRSRSHHHQLNYLQSLNKKLKLLNYFPGQSRVKQPPAPASCPGSGLAMAAERQTPCLAQNTAIDPVDQMQPFPPPTQFHPFCQSRSGTTKTQKCLHQSKDLSVLRRHGKNLHRTRIVSIPTPIATRTPRGI